MTKSKNSLKSLLGISVTGALLLGGIPAHAAASLQTTWNPSLSLSGTVLSVNLPDWTLSSINIVRGVEHAIFACGNQPTVLESLSPTDVTGPLNQSNFSGCKPLSSSNAGAFHTNPLDGLSGNQSVDLNTLYVWNSQNNYVTYLSQAGSIGYLVVRSSAEDADQAAVREVWSSIGHSGANPSSPDTETPAPAPSYAGPKISSFNLPSVAPGGSLVATGKRLNTVQSATIGGLDAGITTSAEGMEISVPEALLPGTYDLVMQTSHGLLTHINAVVVTAKPELSVITLRGSGTSVSEDLAAELAAISALHSSGYNKIHCLVNMADATAAEAIAALACDLLKSGSLADATTLTTLKSTFNGSGFWLRIYIAG